jgi:hypothetical protein
MDRRIEERDSHATSRQAHGGVLELFRYRFAGFGRNHVVLMAPHWRLFRVLSASGAGGTHDVVTSVDHSVDRISKAANFGLNYRRNWPTPVC